MEEDLQTLEPNPETESLSAPAAEGVQNEVAPQTAQPATLSLEEINALTSHRYSNIEEAKKGLLNLKKAVGAKEVPVQDPSLVEQVKLLKKTVEETNFYAEHPELKQHRDVIAKFGDPNTAINDPVVKKVLSALNREEPGPDLQSSPRIAATDSDYQAKFERAKATGNWTEVMAAKGYGVKPQV